MRRRLLQMAVATLVVMAVVTAAFYYFINRYERQDDWQENRVLLYEIQRLTSDTYGNSLVEEQIQTLLQRQGADLEKQDHNIRNWLIGYGCFCAGYFLLLFWYMYWKIIKPFHTLEKYAGELAKGNLEVSLGYERTNFFGQFTWAFDHMRKEMLLSKKAEAAAIQENKTIIATLSHDIKTPIASIRAYGEALEAGLDTTYEKRQYYVATIMQKCDEVTKYTNDLVLHSLSELEKLQMENRSCNIAILLEGILEDLNYPMVYVEGELMKATVHVDQKRFAQVVENIINNAKKYAKGSKVRISTKIVEDMYCISIKDFGEGIPDEDIPFVFDKFYRGKNTNQLEGSGLGLYIVKYIMEKMNGRVELESGKEGLEVWLYFALVK